MPFNCNRVSQSKLTTYSAGSETGGYARLSPGRISPINDSMAQRKLAPSAR
jgi:hypothetical protein